MGFPPLLCVAGLSWSAAVQSTRRIARLTRLLRIPLMGMLLFLT